MKLNRIAVMMTLIALSLPVMAADLEKEEAYWQSELRKESRDQAYALENLARVRERKGEIELAMNTWGYIKKMYAEHNAVNDSSAPDRTYADLADFKMQRLRRVRNQINTPPTRPTPELRKKLSDAQEAVRKGLPLGKAGYVHLLAAVDMDGDLVPEVFAVVGQRDKLGESAKMVLLVYRWVGWKYVEGLHWIGGIQLGKAEEPDFRIQDLEGWGMHSITVAFERETDNAATIQSNGQKIMWAD